MFKIQNLYASISNKDIFNNLSANFSPEKITVISGPSGTGKSLLLSYLAGVTLPERGDIVYNEQSIYNSSFDQIKIIKKKFGIIFQVPALISNLTIFQNLKLALDAHSKELSDVEKSNIITNYLEKFKISSLGDQRPATLSSGQQYIISLIRALITNPLVFLWDDPFINIDESLHDIVNQEISELKKKKCVILFFTNRSNIIKNYGDIIFRISHNKMVTYEL